MKKRKQHKEEYIITPKGLFECALSENKDIWDDLVLFCYRHDYNAILINKEGGEFINATLENEKEGKPSGTD